MLRPTCRAILWSPAPAEVLPGLRAAGCEVFVAKDEERAVELKAEARPEVIFLHKCPPETSGRLRRIPPHLQAVHCLLIARAELAAAHLPGMCDDFLTLPLDPEELAGRVTLWRWRREQIDSEGVLRAGPIVVDLANLRVTVDGVPTTLTYKEYELLCLLLKRSGQVLTRQYILDAIWGPDYYGGARTVDVHIRRLRTKLPEVAEMIVTVHGVGYRLEL